MTGLSWNLSYGFQLEEEGRWDGLFHTLVVVQERSCDCFGNLGGHETWDSKFYGVTYARKLLAYNKR